MRDLFSHHLWKPVFNFKKLESCINSKLSMWRRIRSRCFWIHGKPKLILHNFNCLLKLHLSRYYQSIKLFIQVFGIELFDIIPLIDSSLNSEHIYVHHCCNIFANKVFVFIGRCFLFSFYKLLCLFHFVEKH